MQIGEQVGDLLLGEYLSVAGHLGAADAHDFRDALVVGGQSAELQILAFENSAQARPLLSARGVRFVTAVAVGVVDFAAGGLLRVQSEFSVAFAALGFAADQKKQCQTEDNKS